MDKQIIFDFYNTIYNPKSGRLFRGMSSLLQELKREYRLVLITVKNSTRIEEITECKLQNIFEQIILCRRKNVAIFKKTSSKYRNSIIIGDRKEEEILFASRLNLTSVLVNPYLENPAITIKKAIERRII